MIPVGVERVVLPEELQRECWCPTCARALLVAPTVDPWALCLACLSGHRFFVEVVVDRRASETASGATFPELDDAELDAVALFWLSDPRARAILNSQLAQLLRAILEKRPPETTADATHCPLCASTLELSGLSSGLSTVLVCASKHEWLFAVRALSNSRGIKEAFLLQPEYSRQAIVNLVHDWLKEEPLFAGHVHESVRRVLLASEFAREDVRRPAT